MTKATTNTIAFIVVMALCAITSGLSARAAGSMKVRNFTHHDYDGGPQNWAVVQDADGRIYVGNRDGMLAFDGERWSKHVLPNFSSVRALLYDEPSGRIYASGTEEFGYFCAAPGSGILTYTSLLPTLPADHPTFTEIWRIMKLGDIFYLQCDNCLLRYDGTATRVIPAAGRISCSAVVDNRIYIGMENGDVARLGGDRLATLDGNDILAGKKVMAILPGAGSLILATSVDGLFVREDNTTKKFSNDIDDFLRDNQLFCATANGNDLVFGTVSRGAVVKNFISGMTRYVNKENGMQNNTVLNAAFDMAGNIWLCLDNGIDYAAYNSPLSSLIGAGNDVGAGYASLRVGERMYFGTNQGLYSTAYPFASSPKRLELRRELQGQVWSLTDDGSGDEGFFVASDAGIYTHARNGYSKIAGVTGTYKVATLPNAPTTAIAASYDGFHLLRRHGREWTDDGPVAGDNDVRGSFVLDGAGNLWIAHWRKGIYRMHINAAARRFDAVRHYTDRDGLPDVTNNSVTIYAGRVVASHAEGFFRLDTTSDRFVADTEIARIFAHSSPVLLQCSNGGLVLTERTGINIAIPDSNGNATPMLTHVRSLTDMLVNGYEHVNIVADNEVIVANQTGFWSVDPLLAEAEKWSPAPFVSTVLANSDSVVYRHAAAGTTLELPYESNSLRFEFACPDYDAPGNVQFSSFLEDYDKAWSTPSAETSREYTQIPGGSYRLHLRSYNLRNGEVKETSFPFKIAPPWYRSAVANVAYLLLALLLVVLCIYLMNRWKQRAFRRMERRKEEEMKAVRAQAEQDALQKDFEIASLKSEQLEEDIKHKSNDLSNATMNLIRKNEILNEISSKIAKIQTSATLEQGVGRQLALIQATIKQNISQDDNWSAFDRNFDVVYGDFTKRIHASFPQLTVGDIRLCCYIKMGLSSKEIAPLINISFKSVEMARYRLRRKMDLAPDATLSEFLANF